MVPTESVQGHATSLDSQVNHEHQVFQRPELVEEHVRTFIGKDPSQHPVRQQLFQKQNPQVPGMMSPK